MTQSKFEKIKQAYVEAREQERITISNYLKAQGFEVKDDTSAGSGSTNYKGGAPTTHDMSNWKYVEAWKEEKYFLISLQPYEVHPKDNSIHILMDRIGIYVDDGYSAGNAFASMKPTEIELPMDEDKLDRLVTLLNQRI